MLIRVKFNAFIEERPYVNLLSFTFYLHVLSRMFDLVFLQSLKPFYTELIIDKY